MKTTDISKISGAALTIELVATKPAKLPPVLSIHYPNLEDEHGSPTSFSLAKMVVTAVIEFGSEKSKPALVFAGDRSLLYLVFPSEKTRAKRLEQLAEKGKTKILLRTQLERSILLQNCGAGAGRRHLEFHETTSTGINVVKPHSEGRGFVIVDPFHTTLPHLVPYSSIEHIGCAMERLFIAVSLELEQSVYVIHCSSPSAAQRVESALKRKVPEGIVPDRDVLRVYRWRRQGDELELYPHYHFLVSEAVKACEPGWAEVLGRFRAKQKQGGTPFDAPG